MIFLYQTFTKCITFLPRIKAKVSLLFLDRCLCPQGEITILLWILNLLLLKKKFYSFFSYSNEIDLLNIPTLILKLSEFFYFLNRGYFPCHGQTGTCSSESNRNDKECVEISYNSELFEHCVKKKK